MGSINTTGMVCDQRSRNLVWRSTAWRTRRRSRPMTCARRPPPPTTTARGPLPGQVGTRTGANCLSVGAPAPCAATLAGTATTPLRSPPPSARRDDNPKICGMGCATTCEDEAAAAMLPSTAVLSAPPPCCPNASPAAVLQESQSEECGGEGSRGLEYKSDMYH
jgi:hypothetical protein